MGMRSKIVLIKEFPRFLFVAFVPKTYCEWWKLIFFLVIRHRPHGLKKIVKVYVSKSLF